MNYDKFSKKSKIEKIIYLEDFIKNKEYKYISSKHTRRLFEDIIDNEPNTYLKRVTIDNIRQLVSYNIINKTDAISLLLSVDIDEDAYLIILVLKYLFVYNNNNPDVIERITECTNSSNPEIVSEAYYRISLINFFNIKLADLNLLNYVKHLEAVKVEFERSSYILENRVDAEYYVELLGFLIEILKQDDDNINIKFINMTKKLWELKLNGAEVGLKIEIYKSVLSVKEIYSNLSKLSNWINFIDWYSVKKTDTLNLENILDCFLMHDFILHRSHIVA